MLANDLSVTGCEFYARLIVDIQNFQERSHLRLVQAPESPTGEVLVTITFVPTGLV
jgi:hypothetical protein